MKILEKETTANETWKRLKMRFEGSYVIQAHITRAEYEAIREERDILADLLLEEAFKEL